MQSMANLITAEGKGNLQVGVSVQEFLVPMGRACQTSGRTVMARGEDILIVEKSRPQ